MRHRGFRSFHRPTTALWRILQHFVIWGRLMPDPRTAKGAGAVRRGSCPARRSVPITVAIASTTSQGEHALARGQQRLHPTPPPVNPVIDTQPILYVHRLKQVDLRRIWS